MLIGDMAIKDLSPRDANSSGRIIKNMRICGSGLYEYMTSEAALMQLDIPGDYKEPTFFVFRSPDVLVANKDLYARVPIITGHHVRVTTDNAKQLAVGMVGDTVQSEVGDDGETYLYTTGTIITGDGIEAYQRMGELSVGYDPIVRWQPGEYKGKKYQAVLVGFNEINHLLICKTARGGHQCMIMDEQPWGLNILNGGKNMGIFAKIFGGQKSMTGDAALVSAHLQAISTGADPEAQVAKVRSIIGDCKDATFNDYLNELAGARAAGADDAVLKRAVDIVDDYYAKHIAGDEKPAQEPEKKPEPEQEPTPEPEKSMGDELEKMIGDAVSAAFADIDAKIAAAVKKYTADNKPEEPSVPQENNNPMGGDEGASVISDELMKEMF